MAHAIRDYIMLDKIAVLDLAKNVLGDSGVFALMQVVRRTTSLVALSLASNEISGKGMEIVFEAMTYNQSIITLNLSTVEGANRNRITKNAAKKMK